MKFLIFTIFSLFCSGIQMLSQTDSTIHVKSIEVISKSLEKSSGGSKTIEIHEDILQASKHQTLANLVSEHTGIFIKQYGRGSLATASFRGTAAGHTKLTWNGIEINSQMSGASDLSLIPNLIADNINLKYGSDALENVSGALGGAIELSNIPFWNNGFKINVLQSVASFKTYSSTLNCTYGTERFSADTRLYVQSSANDFTYINRHAISIDSVNSETYNPLDTNKFASYFYKGIVQNIDVKVKENLVASVHYWGQTSERNIPKIASNEHQDLNDRNRQTETSHNFVANIRTYSTNRTLTTYFGFTYKPTLYEYNTSVSGVGSVPLIFSQSVEKQYFWKNRIRYRLKHSDILNVNTNLQYSDVQNTDTVNRIGYSNNRLDASISISYEINLSKYVRLNTVVKSETFNFRTLILIPSIGLELKPMQHTDFYIKTNISRNYKQASLNDLYWFPGGNPKLLPENGMTSEIGILYAKQSDILKLTNETTAFYSNISNWIIWLPSFKGFWQPINIEHVISKGIENTFSIHAKLGILNYSCFVNYSYTSVTNEDNRAIWGNNSQNNQLAYIPKHSGNLMTEIRYKALSVSWLHNYYSERTIIMEHRIGTNGKMYPYFMNNLAASVKHSIQKINIKVDFKIYNLFNETYHSDLLTPMPKRNYELALHLEF